MQTMTVKITTEGAGHPTGKVADAELHFTAGPLEGLKLVGFAVWEKRNGGGYNVTMPARQFSVNGERRSFALLRPLVDSVAQNRLRDEIIAAYEAHQGAEAARLAENAGAIGAQIGLL